MRANRILPLGLLSALAIPLIAGANLSMTPQALGHVEGTLDFCAKVDPDSAAKYKEREKAFVADASKEELEKARSTGEYRESYDSISAQLDKAPKDQAVKGCRDFLAGK
jgi:hypothetical protein